AECIRRFWSCSSPSSPSSASSMVLPFSQRGTNEYHCNSWLTPLATRDTSGFNLSSTREAPPSTPHVARNPPPSPIWTGSPINTLTYHSSEE
ncbi:hypothetical protein PMAYCL1PPCAC_01982, partial [Pristionchus mayeri]